MRYFLPFMTAFLIVIFLAPHVIPVLTRLKASNTERDIMDSHVKKTGTPTMGGIMILLAVVVSTAIFGRKYPHNLPVMLMMFGYGLIGFLDDYLKVVKKDKDGLLPWQKMLLQILVTAAFAVYLLFFSDVSTDVIIPFTHGEVTVNLGILTVPVLFLAVIGTANGTNFTDGVDGLLTTVTIVVASFFGIVSVYHDGGVATVSLAMVGALLGFLQFNCYPAKVFMGDTGSLAIGGYVAATAYMMNMPLFILFVGFIYLVEVISVIIQVTYFKATKGKRFFRMAPIHHHFELGGWSETRVVVAFTTVTLILCLLSLAGMQK